jgi:hypothetical protein
MCINIPVDNYILIFQMSLLEKTITETNHNELLIRNLQTLETIRSHLNNKKL